MAASFREGAVLGLCLTAMVVVASIGAEAQLSTELSIDFYDDSCPQIYDIVKAEIRKAVAADVRDAASLVRLHFHDCFVNGCDGSILLDNSSTGFISEQYAIPNNDSIRGLDVIDAIKAKLEDACPQTVSCADIVAIASRDSAVEAGLPIGYPVFFGRRDSLTGASGDQVLQDLPGPFDDYPTLVRKVEAVFLDEVDLVTLSGAHSIGRVHCRIVLNKIIADNTTVGFNPAFQKINNISCEGNGETLLNLDHTTPNFFDNQYYKNLLKGDSNFISDQVLLSFPGDINQALVEEFAVNPLAFATQFGFSSIRMGNISPLTGDEGEIRLNCSRPNDATSLLASQ